MEDSPLMCVIDARIMTIVTSSGTEELYKERLEHMKKDIGKENILKS